MKYLLDTQILIWYYNQNLSQKLQDILNDYSNDIIVPKIALWEIAIKTNIGKLDLGYSLQELFNLIKKSEFNLLDLEDKAIVTYQNLPLHHKDPFDRMIIAHTIVNKCPVISADKAFDSYKIIRVFD